jgi:hypothetical protein
MKQFLPRNVPSVTWKNIVCLVSVVGMCRLTTVYFLNFPSVPSFQESSPLRFVVGMKLFLCSAFLLFIVAFIETKSHSKSPTLQAVPPVKANRPNEASSKSIANTTEKFREFSGFQGCVGRRLFWHEVQAIMADPTNAAVLGMAPLKNSSPTSIKQFGIPFNITDDFLDHAAKWKPLGCAFHEAIPYPKTWRLPRTALAGYPGSGLHWLRHIIQMASGYLTAEHKPAPEKTRIDDRLTITDNPSTTRIDSDQASYPHNNIIEAPIFYKNITAIAGSPENAASSSSSLASMPSAAICIKTHFPLFMRANILATHFPSTLMNHFDRAVYVIRNPFDAIYNYYFQFQLGKLKRDGQAKAQGSNQSGTQKTDAFSVPLASLDLNEIRPFIHTYMEHYKYWRAVILPLNMFYTLKFEDLYQNPATVLDSLLSFLVPPISPLQTAQFFYIRQQRRRAKIQCALSPNSLAQMESIPDIFLPEGFSYKYYSKSTIQTMANLLSLPLCDYGYDVSVNGLFPSPILSCPLRE